MTETESIPVARLVEPLTVVITTHNQVGALRRHLPAFLSQDYDLYEVIVVDIGSTDETLPWLKAMELEYTNLRHLSTPASARDISLERLGLTLGIRTAGSKWVVLSEANCEPASNRWLSLLAEQLHRHTDAAIVMGFSRYQERHHGWFDHKIGFYRLWHHLANYRHLQSGHAAVRGDGCNMAIRKSLFMDKGGFAATQNLRRGACDLLVNQLSTPANTALCLDPQAAVVQDKPTHQQWQQERMFYVETRRHQQHTWLYRTRNNLNLLWPWFEALCMAVPFLTGIVMLVLSLQRADATYLHPWHLWHHSLLPASPTAPATTEIVIFSLFLLALLAAMVLISSVRIRQFNNCARTLGCRTYRLTFIVFELCMPFWAAAAWLRHRLASKNEFRKQFV